MKKTIICSLLVLWVAAISYASVTGAAQASIVSKQTNATGLSTQEDPVNYTVNKTFSAGSGTTQVCDLVYHTSGSLTAAQDFDLYGTLTDKFGTTLNYKRVKAILIENLDTTNTLTVGAKAAQVPYLSVATTGIYVPPSGFLALTAPLAGWVVTNSTADLITLDFATTTACLYKIWVLGSSN